MIGAGLRDLRNVMQGGAGQQRAWALLLCAVLSLVWYLLPLAPLPVLLAAAPLAILFVFRQTYAIGLLFVLFSFFRLHEAVPQLMPLHLPRLLALATIVGLVWHWVTGGLGPFITRELKLLLAFAATVLLSCLASTHPSESIAVFFSGFVKAVVMSFVVAWLCRSPADFRLTVNGILCAGTVVALIAIYNRLNGIGLVEMSRVTISRELDSVLGDPNDLASVLLFPLSFGIAIVLTPGLSRSQRLFAAVAGSLVMWAILCTQSRGGLLGVATVFGLIGWQTIRNKAFMLMLMVPVLLFVYQLSGVGERAVVQMSGAGVDVSAQGRLHAWQAAVAMAQAHPLTGVGISQFQSNYWLYTPVWEGRPRAAHSSWFEILGETGFLGLMFFVWLNFAVLRKAWRLDRGLRQVDGVDPSIRALSLALLAGMAAHMVSGSFLSHAFMWSLYMLIALIVALSRLLERNHPGDLDGAGPVDASACAKVSSS